MAEGQVIIHSVPSLHVGGVNKALIVTLTELTKGPHQHLVCVMGENLLLAPEIEALGVEVVSLGHRRSTDSLRTLVRFRRLARSRGATVIHSHLTLGRAFGGLVARSCRISAVASLHGTRRNEFVSASDGTVRRARLGASMWITDRLLTSRFVAVSAAVADVYCVGNPGARDRIDIVPNGVVTDVAIPPDAPPDDELRSSLGIPADATVLVNVGRMVPEKDQLMLVPMMAELVSSHPEALLLIVGRGDESVPVQEAVDRADLGGSIRLLGLRDDVPALLHLADLVLVSSISEGFSVAVLEAMAAGRAIVGTDIPAVAEAVRDGIDGLLVPPRSPGPFADAVRTLLDDPERRRAMGASGRARVFESFTAATTASALDRIYSAVGAPRPSATSTRSA